MLDLIKNDLKPKLETKIAEVIAQKLSSENPQTSIKLSHIEYFSNFYLDYEFDLSAHQKFNIENATKSKSAVPLALETQICYDQATDTQPAILEVLYGMLLNPCKNEEDMDFVGYKFQGSLSFDQNISAFAIHLIERLEMFLAIQYEISLVQVSKKPL